MAHRANANPIPKDRSRVRGHNDRQHADPLGPFQERAPFSLRCTVRSCCDVSFSARYPRTWRSRKVSFFRHGFEYSGTGHLYMQEFLRSRQSLPHRIFCQISPDFPGPSWSRRKTNRHRPGFVMLILILTSSARATTRTVRKSHILSALITRRTRSPKEISLNLRLPRLQWSFLRERFGPECAL